jgi:hypothetical protein
VHAYYYDGDPNRSGEIFDIQKIDSIPSGVVDTASFTPKTCGPHWIYLRAVPWDGRVKRASLVTSVNVTVDPMPLVDGAAPLCASDNPAPWPKAAASKLADGCSGDLAGRQ